MLIIDSFAAVCTCFVNTSQTLVDGNMSCKEPDCWCSMYLQASNDPEQCYWTFRYRFLRNTLTKSAYLKPQKWTTCL